MAKKATKGARGSGTIRQRSDGTWEGRFTTGRDPRTGKQVQRSVYGKTQKEVAQKLRQVTVEIDEGTYHEPCHMTVGEWLDIWVEEYTNNVKELTLAAYRTQVRLHIKPALGTIKLTALTTVNVQAFCNSLSRGKKPLAPKTVKNIHGILHKALSKAVVLGFIRFNPADNISLPRIDKPRIKPLTDENVTLFINAIKGTKFEYLYLTDLFTGMRMGEILGLTWDCVDFEHGTITVCKQLLREKRKGGEYKLAPTKNSKTRVITPAPSIMGILSAQRERQEQLRLQAGETWENSEGFVFTNEFGRNLPHFSVYITLKRIMKQIGIPETRFHDLRHSYAVAALQSGDSIKTVQENLGHYAAAFTLDVYGHVSDRMRKESAERMERYFQSVSNSVEA